MYFLRKQKLTTKALRTGDISENILAVGTHDKKVHIIQLEKDQEQITQTFDFFDSNIYAIKILPKNLIAVGCQNSQVFILDFKGDIKAILEGHQGIVNSIDCKDNLLATGSWDTTCKIWDLTTHECLHTLEGHKYSVTCKFLKNGLITGSQDGILHHWDDKFKEINNFQIHTNLIRNFISYQNGILSCSNDYSVKFFDQDLVEKFTQKQHNSFVYSITQLNNDKFFSSGEDQQIVMYIDQQTIQLSTPTVLWCLQSSSQFQRIYGLGEDGNMYIYTLNKNEVNEDEHYDYLQQADIIKLQQPDITEEQLKKFPKIENQKDFVGKKEGEIKVFVNNGKAEAYSWTKGKWDLVGEVVGQNKKQHYEGDSVFPKGDYDYIFDIQEEQGVSKLLPFNKTDNVLTTVEKFLSREQLSVSYKEMIINFINQQIHPQSQTQQPQPQPQTQTNQQPEQQNQSQPLLLEGFPLIDFKYFTNFNKNGFLQKFDEINEIMKTNNTELSLGISQKIHLENLANILSKQQEMQQDDIQEAEQVVVSNLMKWKDENSYLVLDFLRIYCLHRDSRNLMNSFDQGSKFIIYTATCLKFKENKFYTLAIRFLCNLFFQNPQVVLGNETIIYDMLETCIQDFNFQHTKLYLNFYNNYLSYCIQNQKFIEPKMLFQFLMKQDLSSLKQDSEASLNFILCIGNTIFFNNEEIQAQIKKPEFIELVTQTSIDEEHQNLKNSLLNYLRSQIIQRNLSFYITQNYLRIQFQVFSITYQQVVSFFKHS